MIIILSFFFFVCSPNINQSLAYRFISVSPCRGRCELCNFPSHSFNFSYAKMLDHIKAVIYAHMYRGQELSVLSTIFFFFFGCQRVVVIVKNFFFLIM
jgi:hypothetical protein